MDTKELLELAATFGDDMTAILETMADDIEPDTAGDILGHLHGEDIDEWREFFEQVGGYLSAPEAAEVFAEHSDDSEKRSILAEYVSDGYSLSYFEESYAGEWRTFLEFAENLADECGMVPEGSAGNYFDYEKFANDLQHDYFTIDRAGKVHVFRSM